MKQGRVIVIEPGPPTMAALIVDGRLEDLLIDPPAGDETPMIEEIHRVRVRRVIARQGAAHVKLESGGKGFLRDAKDVAEGDLVVAQVTGFAEPGKGPPMTAHRLHRGRYAILTPHASGANVSRALKDPEERARLAAIGAERVDENGPGLIIRTAARDRERETILEDIDDLLALEASVAADGPPGKLADAPGAEVTAWREWGDPDDLIREAGAFDQLGLWEEIRALRTLRADLGHGAWMMVEPTSALVAVDVNTGADMSNDAAAKANLATCNGIFRQLRLRGLGGQITIDFAPMRKNDRKAVESALKKAAAADPIRTTFAGWTPLGQFEMLRKRERRPIRELLPDV